eukprot:5849628-Alexandrium_andersonii.AAC.1
MGLQLAGRQPPRVSRSLGCLCPESHQVSLLLQQHSLVVQGCLAVLCPGLGSLGIGSSPGNRQLHVCLSVFSEELYSGLL